MTAHAAIFLAAAAVVWILYEGAATPPEGRMDGIWAAQAGDDRSTWEERAEALYRLGLHREQAGDYDGAMEAYHRLLSEIPYPPFETAAVSWGFRQDEARWNYRELLRRAAAGEIELKKSWPPH